MSKKQYIAVVVLIVIDQLTKWIVDWKMTLGRSIELIKDFFYLTYSRNTGAAWSMFSGARWAFVILAFGVVATLWYYLNNGKVNKVEALGYLGVMAGAIGNVIDRITNGYVIDFLDFYIFGYDFPIFNFADICICIGVGLVVISILFEKEK